PAPRLLIGECEPYCLIAEARGNCSVDRMKTVHALMIIVLSAGCSTSVKPAAKTPAARAPIRDGGGGGCDPHDCGANGTQLTGLTTGDHFGAVRTLTLPSGEVITPR